jgi:hypothetical protein
MQHIELKNNTAVFLIVIARNENGAIRRKMSKIVRKKLGGHF